MNHALAFVKGFLEGVGLVTLWLCFRVLSEIAQLARRDLQQWWRS